MTIRRSRQLVAILALTAVLCVDRVAAPASSAGPQVASLVRRLAGRLTVSLRQVVPMARIPITRQADVRLVATPFTAYEPTRPIAPQSLHPFQFRLPPPAC